MQFSLSDLLAVFFLGVALGIVPMIVFHLREKQRLCAEFQVSSDAWNQLCTTLLNDARESSKAHREFWEQSKKVLLSVVAPGSHKKQRNDWNEN